MNVEKFNQMESYTFDEGVAFLVLVKAPVGVINHLKTTHNRNHLHGEIHKQLRLPKVKQMLKQQGCDDVEQEPVIAESSQKETESNPADIPSDKENATEIVLTKLDVRKHENTRFEDMPNALCQELWLKRQDVYREMQQAHLKMRSVPKGEVNNEKRAKWRAEVLRLDELNDSYWQQIDAEIERFKVESERAEKSKVKPLVFNVSTYRTYVSKALRKKQLSPEQFAELQHRVDALLSANEELKPETIDKLKSIGIKVG